MSGGRGLTYNFFSSNGTWVCPAGVTSVFVIGIGGGAGGAGGTQTINQYRPGGNASVPRLQQVDVVPGTSYSITIGAGGAGGTGAATNTSGTFGSSGGVTLFGGTAFFGAVRNNLTDTFINSYHPTAYSFGTVSTNNTVNNSLSMMSAPPQARSYYYTSSRGTNSNGSYFAGGDGAGGYTGTGGAGSNAISSGSLNGTNAASGNYGAGGGGGACRATSPGNGGTGAPGALWVVYVEGSYKLNVKTYLANDTWKVPAGVTAIMVLGQGCGGNGGNSSVSSQVGASGGMATYLTPDVLDVTPNDTYVITVPTISVGLNVLSNSSIDNSLGNKRTWLCAGNGTDSNGTGGSGAGYIGTATSTTNAVTTNVPINIPGATNGLTSTIPFCYGNTGNIGTVAARGANSNVSTDGAGGAPGNSSDAGIGGAGGSGAVGATVALNGSNAPNVGAGGGGAGAPSTTAPVSIKTGGKGGGGRIIVVWSE